MVKSTSFVAEGSGLTPGIHVGRQLTVSCYSSFGGSDTRSSSLHRHLHTRAAQKLTQAHRQIDVRGKEQVGEWVDRGSSHTA